MNLTTNKRTTLFGSKDALDLYRKTKDLAFKRNIFRICQFQKHKGTKQLIICNTWRIDRKGNYFSYYLRDLLGEWYRVAPSKALMENSDFRILPMMHVYNLSLTTRDLLKAAMFRCAIDCGYYSAKPEKIRLRTVNSVIVSIEKKSHHASVLGARAGLRSLTACLWEHFIDRDLFKALIAAGETPQGMRLATYLKIAPYKKHFMARYQENPNLASLMIYMKPSQWKRDDLWHADHWVGENSRVKPVRFKNQRHSALCFDRKGIFNHFKRTRPTVIRELIYSGGLWGYFWVNVCIHAFAVLEPPSKKMPAMIDRALLRLRVPAQIGTLKPSSQRRLVSLLRQELYDGWKWQGKSGLSNHKNRIVDMLDWYDREGIGRGLPEKNTTMASLYRRSAVWHQALQAIEIEKLMEQYGDVSWRSQCIHGSGSVIVDGYQITPLTSAMEVIQEGSELSHCVSSYITDFARGGMEVFIVQSMTYPKDRTTLGVNIDWDQGKKCFSIFQNQGFGNSPASKDNSKAIEKFVDHLNCKGAYEHQVYGFTI